MVDKLLRQKTMTIHSVKQDFMKRMKSTPVQNLTKEKEVTEKKRR